MVLDGDAGTRNETQKERKKKNRYPEIEMPSWNNIILSKEQCMVLDGDAGTRNETQKERKKKIQVSRDTWVKNNAHLQY